MNHHRAIVSKHSGPLTIEKSGAHDIAIERSGAAQKSPPQTIDCGARTKIISGRVVALVDDDTDTDERPLGGVQVDLHAVSSLNDVVHDLPPALLAHSRTLLLGHARPMDLYRGSDNIADAPIISFADIVLLRELPRYALLVASAKLQSDAAFKQQLCSSPEILHSLLCYYHPGYFSAQCCASTTADANGYFQFSIQHYAKGSADANKQPGYRFSVRRPITSNLYLTLYNPTPAAWYTRWDWSNTDSITLRTRHPLALRAQSKT